MSPLKHRLYYAGLKIEISYPKKKIRIELSCEKSKLIITVMQLMHHDSHIDYQFFSVEDIKNFVPFLTTDGQKNIGTYVRAVNVMIWDLYVREVSDRKVSVHTTKNIQ